MEEKMRVIREQELPHQCELVWMKETVFGKQDISDLRTEIKGKLTSYLEKNHISSDQYKVWMKEKVLGKQEVNDLQTEIKGKLTSFLETNHTSSDQHKVSVWEKGEMLGKQEVNDLQTEINGKLTSYLEKNHTSTDQHKVSVKEDVLGNQPVHDLQTVIKEKLTSYLEKNHTSPDQFKVCMEKEELGQQEVNDLQTVIKGKLTSYLKKNHTSSDQFKVCVEELGDQEVNDLQTVIKGKLTSYLKKNHTSSDQYKEGDIIEEHEPILQVWIKQETKQQCYGPSQAADEQKLQSEYMTDSSEEYYEAENENVQNGDKRKSKEETELEDIKSMHETRQEQEPSPDAQLHLETMKRKYCCRQSMLQGTNCDLSKKPTDNPSSIYKCQICDTEFVKTDRLLSQMNVCTDKNFQCGICFKLFIQPRSLLRHIRRAHCGEVEYLCPTCGKQFKTNYELKLHLVCHSSERKNICPVCNKLFLHQRRLASANSYSC
ncbi:zinc finger and SCAN domain-containing protein 26 isoform X2 [Anabrus simplex]|uniref:zinc finger and SCAN domain-containing protein 26 isoform X2 n=1 Tax=Anabrus simplex TaxID=316456 RepID=UPI0035A39DC5